MPADMHQPKAARPASFFVARDASMCEIFAADGRRGKKKIRLIGRRGKTCKRKKRRGGKKERKDASKKLTPGMVCREVVLPHYVLVLVDHVQTGPGEHQPGPRHHAVQFRVGVPPPLLRYRGRSHHAEHACGVGGIAREEEKSWARTYDPRNGMS